MKQYIDIVKNVLNLGKVKKPVRKGLNGKWEPVDGGVSTLALPNQVFSHDMKDGFPLLTTKRVAWKAVRVELEGFIKGITDKRWFQKRNVHIWDNWSNPEQLPEHLVMLDKNENEVWEKIDGDLKKKWQFENPDLGPLGYSHGWRNFGGSYKPIPFIWTDLDKQICVKKSNEELVGQEFNGKYGQYTVISYDGKDKYHNKKYSVKFHASGFVKKGLSKKQIQELNVFDPYFPQICGVACVGDYKWIPIDKTIASKLMNQWRQMIQRCYNPKNHAYKDYGEKNIWVSNRWLVFEYFLLDVQKIEGWESKIRNWRQYQLDKDIKGKNYYGKEACIWATVSDNTSCTRQNYYFDACSPEGQVYENIVGLSKFCRKHGLKTKNVEASMVNGTKTHNGWKFTRKNKLKIHQPKKGVDQLANIVNTLMNNPMDRRMVCSAWNPPDIDRVALPSCHFVWNVTVIGDELNLFWTQRSCDLALGAPLNIASYALLLELLAHTAGFKPGNLSGVFVDCHLYENQIDAAKEQITREPRKLPTITFKGGGKNFIFDWTYKDVELVNYSPLSKINFGAITV